MTLRAPEQSLAASRPGKPTVSGMQVDARDFGIHPDRNNAFTSELAAALNQAAAVKSVLVLQPGQYNYDNTVDVVGGGGMVCLNGYAQLNAQSATYDKNAISFTGASASNRYVGFKLEGVVFNNATRPNAGIANDAPESAAFIRLTNIRDVYVARNRVIRNYGGFILLRNVEDALIERNVVKDIWKDGFHTTDASNNIWRERNVVVDCGDDAFATVGYIYRGVRPMFIYDFDNYVYGCRMARAFAYVGCAHVRSRNYVDGRVMEAPQVTSVDGYYLRNNCALYVGSEYLGAGSTYNTYGVDDIKAHIDAQHLGPIVTTPGGSVVAPSGLYAINSYEAIHVIASGQPHSDVEITGTLRNISKGGLYTGGADGITNFRADVKIIDNTDPDGWRGTAGAFVQRASEFQYLRGNSDIRVDATTTGHAAIIIGNTSTGNVKAFTKINDICKGSVQDAITVQTGAALDTLSVGVDVDWDIPAGRLDQLIDLASVSVNELIIDLRGKGSISNISTSRGAAGSVQVPISTSPHVIANTGTDDVFLQIIGGTSVAVAQTSILTHVSSIVASVSGNVLSVTGDVSALFNTSRHVAFLTGSPFDLSRAIAISSVNFSAGTTSITLASAPPAAGTYLKIAPVYSEVFTNVTGNLRRFIKLAKNRAIRVIHSGAPTVWATSAKQ